MVTSWILNSLTKEISDSVEYVNDSVELWKELEDRYDQTNGAKLYQIQKEINDLTQGNLDITVYYTRIKKLWEELNTLNMRNQCSCTCTCGAKDGLHRAEQDRRLVQFLMGMNEAYTVVRGNILMMNPLPSMAHAFSLLIQEEKQREFRPSSRVPMESASLSVNTSNSNGKGPAGRNYKTSFSNNNYSGSNSTSGNNNNYGGSNYHSGSSSNRNVMFCDLCKKTGHIREKCYKLNGYPQGHNNQANRNNGFYARQNNNHEYKGKRVVANVHGSPDDMMPAQGEDCPQVNHKQNAILTKDQYAHIMNLLQHFRVEGEDSTNSNTGAGSVNFAGIVVCSSSVDFGKSSCECFNQVLPCGSLIRGHQTI